MKLKKVAALCSRQGVFHLYDEVDDDGELVRQWLGDYGAIYPLYGLPVLDEENLCTMFDISEKKRKKCSFRRERAPRSFCLDDNEPGEQCLYSDWPTVEYNGFVVKPLSTREGIVFIQNAYLVPLEDMEDYLRLFERRTEDGQRYIVAKNGMEIAAIIMPMDTIKMGFVDKLEQLAHMCRATLEAMEEQQRRREALAASAAAAEDEDQTSLLDGGDEV